MQREDRPGDMAIIYGINNYINMVLGMAVNFKISSRSYSCYITFINITINNRL